MSSATDVQKKSRTSKYNNSRTGIEFRRTSIATIRSKLKEKGGGRGRRQAAFLQDNVGVPFFML